jgi:hypothetical protein
MKQCPQCRTTYTDDTLRFCLSDGSVLTSMPGGAEAETVVSFNPAKPVVIDIPQNQPTFAPPASYQPPPTREKRGISPLLVGAIVALLVLVIAALGGVILYQVYSGKDAQTNLGVNSPTATPTATKSPAATPGKTPANTNQWNGTKPANAAPTTTPDRPEDIGTLVTVHSPGDGYLVLRSQPNSSSTEITRIPHGTDIYLKSCGEYTTTKLGNYGRWCTTAYNGFSGWVFDAFVKY